MSLQRVLFSSSLYTGPLALLAGSTSSIVCAPLMMAHTMRRIGTYVPFKRLG